MTARLPHREIGGQRPGGENRRVRQRAEPRAVDPLVFRNGGQDRANPRTIAGLDGLLDGWLHRVRNQTRADVQIPHEPADREVVDERQHGIRECRQHQEQRDDEAKGEAHAVARVEFESPRSPQGGLGPPDSLLRAGRRLTRHRQADAGAHGMLFENTCWSGPPGIPSGRYFRRRRALVVFDRMKADPGRCWILAPFQRRREYGASGRDHDL